MNGILLLLVVSLWNYVYCTFTLKAHFNWDWPLWIATCGWCSCWTAQTRLNSWKVWVWPRRKEAWMWAQSVLVPLASYICQAGEWDEWGSSRPCKEGQQLLLSFSHLRQRKKKKDCQIAALIPRSLILNSMWGAKSCWMHRFDFFLFPFQKRILFTVLIVLVTHLEDYYLTFW